MKNLKTFLQSQTILLVVAVMACNMTDSVAQIAAWDFFGESSPATSTADVFNANLDSSSSLTRGAGAASSTGSNSFRTQGFQNNGIATTNTDYFQFTLSASSGYSLSLSTIDAKFNGTASFFATPGVTSQFAYSLDGTNFTLIGSAVQSTSLTLSQISLTGISALQSVGDSTTVTFRYYASGNTTTGGWGFTSASAGTYGLSIGGNVTATGGGGAAATWTGNGSGGTWQNGSQGHFASAYTNDLANTVTFNGTAETVTTSGTVQAGSLTFSSADYIVNGALTLNGTVTASTGNATINAVVSGSNGLTSAGAGTLILAGANDYSGATSVSAGALRITNSSALGATGAGNGTTVATGAALQVSNNISSAEAISLNGTGVSADGALRNISGNNTLSGAVTLGAAARINSDAGTLALSGGISGTQDLTVGGAGNTDISGVIATGTGNFTKDGAGTATFSGSGANTYSGLTTVGNGTLQLNKTGVTAVAGNLTVSAGSATLLASNQIADTSAVTVSGGTLGIGSNSDTVASVALSSGNITGTSGILTATSGYTVTNTVGQTTLSAKLAGGTLAKSGAGDVLVSGDNSYSGATTITGGTLTATSANALGSTAAGTTVSAGGALQIQGGITTAAEDLTIGGTGIASGGALRNVSGDNTYAGAITVASPARINSDSGTLNLNVASGNAITGSDVGVTLGGAGNVAVADAINLGTGAITKDGAGSLTLSVANTYSGGTTLSAGTIIAGASGALGSGSVSMTSGSLVGSNGTTTANNITIGTAGGTPETYTQNFNNIGGGLPTSWTVTTNATASALGTTATLTTAATDWVLTTGQFANFASATGLTSSANATTQAASTDRALGIRQTAAFGDPGAAFNYAFSTTGQTVSSISLDLMMLSVQTRSTTWSIQYGIGASPASFTSIGTWADPGAFGTTTVTYNTGNFSTNLDNQSNVVFRVVALTASSGTGSRDSMGIDNFQLNTSGGAASGTGTLGINTAGSTTFSGNVTINNTATLTAAAGGTAAFSGAIGGNGSITKTDLGTIVLSGGNSYTGTTLVSAGTLLIEGAQTGNGTFTVQSGAAIGGDGSIAGSLALDAGAKFVFDLTKTFTVNGASVTFGGFGISNLVGLDSSVAAGTYTLINGSAAFDFTNVLNFGAENAVALGDGKSAYFKAGSFDLVVVPEPNTCVMFGIGASFMLWNLRRRRRFQG